MADRTARAATRPNFDVAFLERRIVDLEQ
jgi:hypothetical protein